MSNNPSYRSTTTTGNNDTTGGSGLNWDSLSDKEAKTLDNFDLGKVKQITNDYIYTEKGHWSRRKSSSSRRDSPTGLMERRSGSA